MTRNDDRMTKNSDDQAVRLDKWLWAARFFKSRALAKTAIEGGKIDYKGQRAKACKLVEVGATLHIRMGPDVREIVILAISGQRRGAPEAQLLYQETESSIKTRADLAWQRKTLAMAQLPPARRPTKKGRRDIARFKEQATE